MAWQDDGYSTTDEDPPVKVSYGHCKLINEE
jgi:hypothetical protein